MTDDELFSTVKRLRIENEVNKIMIHSLKLTLLNHKDVLIDECLESINFVSDIVEKQIKQSWTEEETIFFKELIEQQVREFSLLNSKN
jgi:spore coat protein CotF